MEGLASRRGIFGRPGRLVAVLVVSVAVIAAVAPEALDAQVRDDLDPCVGADDDRLPDELDEVIVPSRDFRTIQAGICAVGDGGVVVVLPGTHTQRFTVWGKHVEIRGSGNADEWPVVRWSLPTEVVPADEAEGVVTVGGGGILELTKLTIVGGDVGLLVLDGSGPVDVKHSSFADNGRGILSRAAEPLTIKHTRFSGQLWNGISFAPFDLTAQNCGGLDISHGVLGTTGNAGIYVRGCFHTIDHTSINFADGGGIVAIASAVNIDHVNIAFSRYFGILLVNTVANVKNSRIDFTDAGPLPPNPDNVLGDAIVVWSTTASWAQGGPGSSTVLLENSDTFDSERAALFVLGGHATLKNNTFVKQLLDGVIEDHDGFTATVTDLGGNVCLLEGFGMVNDGCTRHGTVAPPPPVGGLE